MSDNLSQPITIHANEEYLPYLEVKLEEELREYTESRNLMELAQRNPEHLFAKLVDINDSKNLVRRLPNLEQVEDWITQAKRLPRVVEY